MKLIALLPVKNEAWALPSYLSSVQRVADQIIALDDSSTDASTEVLNASNAEIHHYDAREEDTVNMSARRRRLLELGRVAGGTHFIWLDADETFSANFIDSARKTIASLVPGQKLTMRWVHAWKDTGHYIDDTHSPFGRIWKDFVVCDDQASDFADQYLSEARTPGAWGNPLVLPEKAGVVVHWQFARWKLTQYKQALYRCLELLEGHRSARRINHTYSITLDQARLQTKPLPTQWINNIIIPELSKADSVNHFRKRILELFEAHGIERFEPLQIWHLADLKAAFTSKLQREPQIQVYPSWLITLNKLRHGNKN